MPQQQVSMYLVRVYFKSGAIMNFNFRDMGKAQECSELLGQAKLIAAQGKPAAQYLARVFDAEGARESVVDGAEIAMTQFVDCDLEIKENVRLEVVLNAFNMRYRAMAGLLPEQPPNGSVQQDTEIPINVGRAPVYAT
jgi:hypothetical protein